jgi:hypothetical protein
LTSEEIDQWLLERAFGARLGAFDRLRNDIHALFQKANDAANFGREERDRTVALLEELDGLDIWNTLGLSDYYQWRYRELSKSQAAGSRGPSPEQMINGFIRLCRAATDVLVAAELAADQDRIPGTLDSHIAKGVEEFDEAFRVGRGTISALGHSLSCLHADISTLCRCDDDLRDVWSRASPLEKVKQIIFGDPEVSTSFYTYWLVAVHSPRRLPEI